MVKEVKWTKYLWLNLLSFGAFMLELLSIFAIEVIILHSPAFFKEALSFSRKGKQKG